MVTKDQKYFADVVIPPGETILEMLEVNNMTQADFSNRLGFSRKHVNEIIKGKAVITPDTALKLESIFKLPANFWNNLEANYQDSLARMRDIEHMKEEERIVKLIPYAVMVRLGWVPKTRKVEEKIKNLRKFFRVANLLRIDHVYGVAFRKSQSKEASLYSLAAWLAKGEELAMAVETQPFSKKILLSSISELRRLTKEESRIFISKVKRICAECGIALVIVPHLPGTYAHGAAKWLSSDKVMIELSIRNKYSDIFWFSFFHELGHILLHNKKEIYIEYCDVQNELEDEADCYAANTLIPKEKYKKFVNTFITKQSLIDFAEELEIDPSIVVGRLQHDSKLQHNQFNDLRLKLEWS